MELNSSDIFCDNLDSPNVTSTPIRTRPRSAENILKRSSHVIALNDCESPIKQQRFQFDESELITLSAANQTDASSDSVLPSLDELDANQCGSRTSQSNMVQVSNKDLDVIHHVRICGEDISYTIYDDDIFLSCQILPLAAFTLRHGYGYVDSLLRMKTKQKLKLPLFLVWGLKRNWIRRSALLSLLRHKGAYKLAQKKIVEEAVQALDKDTTAPNYNPPQVEVTNDNRDISRGQYMSLCGMDIPYYAINQTIYLEIDKLFQYIGLEGHLAKNSWKFVDACLSKQGAEPSMCFDTVKFRCKRNRMSVTGLQILLTKFRPGDKTKKGQLQMDLQAALMKTAATKTGSTNANPGPLELVKSKQSLLDSIVDCIAKTDPKTDIEDFSGSLSKDDIIYVLKSAYDRPSKSAKKKVKDSAYAIYKHIHPIDAADVVHFSENYSGTRLMREMRKKIPGIIPSAAQEQLVKREYKKQFEAVLLPRRTATGWMISPIRLLHMLSFRYPFLSSHFKVRLWGDGREIGGSHSTFLAITLLNDDLLLRGVPYQSPHETFPVAIFYESDSRDNLETNLGFNNLIEHLHADMPENEYFLCGDEMFLIKVLDGSKELSPTSSTGWNFYHKAEKDQKKETHSNGLRTDLPVLLDRAHPETLFPSIPLHNTVFDIMHGLTRIVEKLLNLEVEKILSEGNKSQQTSQDSPTAKQLLDNMVANINKRGIRQGNFKIHFDRNGKPEPVSLNKDHALSIISRPPAGKEEEYPHVLHNVVPRRKVLLPFPAHVLTYINMDAAVEEFEVVSRIWDCLCSMFKIAKSDPLPQLLPGKQEGSLHVGDYTWGYSAEDLRMYKVHAECFYQLVRWRYSWQNITPYMVKFIDYARHFMHNLNVPISRFQAEGGEHLNYQHSRHFFQHTTRKGGKDKMDTQLALFSAMFKKLSYDITASDEEDAASCFNTFVKRHVAACTIQAAYRGHVVREVLKGKGFFETNDSARKTSALEETQNQLYPEHVNTIDQKILSGFTFVFVGGIPSQNKKKWTHSSLHNVVTNLGGKVSKGLPGNTKGRSTKRYHLLYNQASMKSKTPDILKEALRRGYGILSYNFVFDAISQQNVPDIDEYAVDLSHISSLITCEPSLHEQHFQKKVRMISLLKQKKSPDSTMDRHSNKVESNAAQLYGNLKRKEATSEQNLSFSEQAKLFGKECTNFTSLSGEEKSNYISLWREKRQQVQNSVQAQSDLQRYNIISNPLYKRVF